MKNTIYHIAIGSLLLLSLGGCKEEDSSSPEILPGKEGTFTDLRDGVEYRWVRYGNLEWMSENLRAEAETGVYRIYAESDQTQEEITQQQEQNFRKFGYWYDYTAAEAAVPDGWRLPSDGDWQNLEKWLGMAEQELTVMGWRGDWQGEMMQQKTGLSLVPGGFIDYKQLGYTVTYTPGFMGFYGFFWSSSAEDSENSNTRIYRQIRYNSSRLGRFSTSSNKLMHVRCVRDAVGQ